MRTLPFAIFALAAAVLIARWDAIPETWAVHWNAADVADGFATKSPASVLGPLAVGAFVVGLVEIVTRASLARGGADDEIRAASRRFVTWISSGVALVVAMLAVALPLAAPTSGAHLAVVALVIVLGSLAGGLATMPWKATGDGWYGVVYKNAEDPRLWVPKRLGVGWTVNFGHRAAVPVTLALVLGPIVVAVAVALASRR